MSDRNPRRPRMIVAALFLLLLTGALAGQTPAPNAAASPRLAALKADLEKGDGTAPMVFWKEAALRTAPLVEPNPADPKTMLVTFLWRGDADVPAVVVVGYALGPDRSKNIMEKLPGTDLWYRTRILPADLRMVYGFAVNPSRPSVGPPASWRRDPLNPHTFVFFKDPDSTAGEDLAASLLELPQAAPQPWIKKVPGRSEGRVERFLLKSEILKNERRIFVYTPPGYDPKGLPCALLVVFDGREYIGQVATPVTMDNLIAEKRIPPTVAVFVDNANPFSRGKELGDYPPMAEFLARELRPWIRARWRVSDDPSRAAIAGSSSGGIAAVCAAVRHPEIFGNVLAQSGAYFDDAEGPIGDEWIYRYLIGQPKLPIRFSLDVGRYEPLFSVNASRHLRNVLEAKGYAVRYAEFAGGHDYSQWRGTLADGLIDLLGK